MIVPMKACERGPYVYDSGNHSAGVEVGLALGVGSTFQFKKPSLIYGNAAGIGWIGELHNAIDGTDYADFFGLSDASCGGRACLDALGEGRGAPPHVILVQLLIHRLRALLRLVDGREKISAEVLQVLPELLHVVA